MRAIGVDMVEIERIAESAERFGDRFLKRVYTPQELAYCDGRAPSLAARWAAKEAVAKALGTGIGDVSWQEIEIISQPNGKPQIKLHGAALDLAAQMGISEFALSISHTREYAIAFVVGD